MDRKRSLNLALAFLYVSDALRRAIPGVFYCLESIRVRSEWIDAQLDWVLQGNGTLRLVEVRASKLP